MDIRELFRGVAVIIDDEINDRHANIQKILKQIEDKKIPYLSFSEIPDDEILQNFKSISFILLDWKLSVLKTTFDGVSADEISIPIPQSIEEVEIRDKVEFLSKLKQIVFVPIFIFTNEDKDSVISVLKDYGLYNDEKPNFIFVENKNKLTENSMLFSSIENWVKSTPSIYVLKEWEKNHRKAKIQLFWDFYERSPRWPIVLWDTFKKDGVNPSKELGDVITRNIYSRLTPYSFEEEFLRIDENIDIEEKELRDVLEGERFINAKFLNKNDIFTGDLFKEEKLEDGQQRITYWLNIRPQCDLLRDNNPDLYCIKGRVIDETNDEEIKKRGYKFEQGHFIEKKNHVIVPCIDGGKIIEFLFKDLKIKKWNELKEKRIGRLLPPYITRIKQLYSAYFQREGIPRYPEEAFSQFAQSTR